MDWLVSTAKVAVPAVTALAALLGAVVAAMHTRGRRHSLSMDVQVLSAMPEGPARDKLMTLIEAEVDALVLHETDASRQVDIAVVAGLFAIAFTGASLAVLAVGGWWQVLLVLTIPLAAVLAYGVFESAAKVPRDVKGNRLPVVGTSTGTPKG